MCGVWKSGSAYAVVTSLEYGTHHSSDSLEQDPGWSPLVERTGLFGVDNVSLWDESVSDLLFQEG